jgi:hypothetical protein
VPRRVYASSEKISKSHWLCLKKDETRFYLENNQKDDDCIVRYGIARTDEQAIFRNRINFPYPDERATTDRAGLLVRATRDAQGFLPEQRKTAHQQGGDSAIDWRVVNPHRRNWVAERSWAVIHSDWNRCLICCRIGTESPGRYVLGRRWAWTRHGPLAWGRIPLRAWVGSVEAWFLIGPVGHITWP